MKKSHLLLVVLLLTGILTACDQKQTKVEEAENKVDSAPEVRSEEVKPNSLSKDCTSACENYVSKCLTLVPNASDTLLNEGLVSCVEDCANWSADKAECISEALECPSMTEICKL
jgi:hypothetical protein